MVSCLLHFTGLDQNIDHVSAASAVAMMDTSNNNTADNNLKGNSQRDNIILSVNMIAVAEQHAVDPPLPSLNVPSIQQATNNNSLTAGSSISTPSCAAVAADAATSDDEIGQDITLVEGAYIRAGIGSGMRSTFVEDDDDHEDEQEGVEDVQYGQHLSNTYSVASTISTEADNHGSVLLADDDDDNATLKSMSSLSSSKRSYASSGRPTNKSLKARVADQPLRMIDMMACSSYDKNCPNKYTCCKVVTAHQIMLLRKDIWGDFDYASDPSDTDRVSKYHQYLRRANYKKIVPANDNKLTTTQHFFHFCLPSERANDKQVWLCESAFLQLSHLVEPANLVIQSDFRVVKKGVLSKAPSAYRALRKCITDNISDREQALQIEIQKLESVHKQKALDVEGFLRWAGDRFGDTSPDAGNFSYYSNCLLNYYCVLLLGQEKVKVLPFESVTEAFDFYQRHRRANGINPEAIAHETTFRRVFNESSSALNVRLIKSKGAFKTCIICNVIYCMLRNNGTALTSLICY